jgi:hypothetical protein
MTFRTALLWLQAFVITITIGVGCGGAPLPAGGGTSPSPATSAAPAKRAMPTSVAEAEAQQKAGIRYSNEEVRAHYIDLVGGIDAANERWLKEGLSAEQRARRAYKIRQDARITTRAMMSDPSEVEDLRKRDQEKYSNPDGPTFEWLVNQNQQKGLAGDAVYEAIVVSSQRTDKKVNESFNLKGKDQ